VKPANVPDDRWQTTVSGVTADAHDVLGQAAVVRKDYPTAIAEYKLAVAASPDPVVYARLAQADNKAGQYDDAIAAAEKAMNMPNSPASVKQFGQAERARAMQMKAKAAAPATPAAPPAPAAPATPPNQ
jgi:tetratricopeptide (TPR) repeat protein